jgi:hypothetical protein
MGLWAFSRLEGRVLPTKGPLEPSCLPALRGGYYRAPERAISWHVWALGGHAGTRTPDLYHVKVAL